MSSDATDDGGVQPSEQPATEPTGEEAPAEPSTDVEPPTEPDEFAALKTQLAERTADLQRLQAEYVNYKRRVDRDRAVVRETATAAVLGGLLPVLDDIDRARDHGELEGGFKAVAESLERVVAKLGLERFGEPGDEFDPRIHEGLMHDYADDVDTVTAQAILQVGYRMGERIIRPARVAVVEPKPVDAPVTPEPTEPDVSDAESAEVAEPAEPEEPKE